VKGSKKKVQRSEEKNRPVSCSARIKEKGGGANPGKPGGTRPPCGGKVHLSTSREEDSSRGAPPDVEALLMV